MRDRVRPHRTEGGELRCRETEPGLPAFGLLARRAPICSALMAGEEWVTCFGCGARRDGQADPVDALAWMAERERGSVRWLCPRCAREHARDIESKLPSEEW